MINVSNPNNTVIAPTFGTTSTTSTTLSTTTPTYSPSDKFAGISLSSTKTTTPVDEANKKAGTFKMMMNSVGNGISKFADMVGLGTISKFAKDNFTLLDTNKDNNLNTTEFNAVSQLVGKSFTEIDSNVDQKISFGEFKTLARSLVESELKATDTNGDGFINLSEAGTHGYVVNQGNQNSFTSHDSNGDGLLSLTEFAGLVNDRKFRKSI